MSDNQKVFRERFSLLEEETEAKLKKKDKVSMRGRSASLVIICVRRLRTYRNN